MKYKEFHKLITQQGWLVKRQTGSHIIYEKEGRIYPVPFHGSKDMDRDLERKIKREMGLK
jgi:mRNA interferase HicA